jgi:hypothetical protein
MVPFKLLGCLVVQGGAKVMLVIRGDPVAEGGDQLQGTDSLLEPQVLFLEGTHEALHVSMMWSNLKRTSQER